MLPVWKKVNFRIFTQGQTTSVLWKVINETKGKVG